MAMAAARSWQRLWKAIPACKGKQVGKSFSSGGSAGGDDDLLRDVPTAPRKESTFWTSLIGDKEKKQPIVKEWDFLKELNQSSRSSGLRSSSSPSFSYRKLADTGLDFVNEDLERLSSQKSEPSEGQESVVKSLLQSASYELLKETLATSRENAAVKETLGFDVVGSFSSLDVDSRTLAEVEGGNFYSSSAYPPPNNVKTYTYEELGEKLRLVRPPKEQMLSSAIGLSFGELRDRLQKIEELNHKELETDDSKRDYNDLRECLNHLRPLNSPKAVGSKLTYEDLAFLNTIGSRSPSHANIEYSPPNNELLTKYFSEVQLSSKEHLELEIKKLRTEFQTHENDSGSPQVQIAILTARINNLNRHMRQGPNLKRDKHSKKGLNDMVQYRKRLLRYLRRRDWPIYCNVLTKLKLDDVILEKRR